MQTRFDLAQVIREFGAPLLTQTKLTPLQLKVLGKITHCRTAALGGHQEACENCGTIRYSYNSCGDRHCPRCQAARQAFWIEGLLLSTLPVKHYHLVFTVPHQLNAVCLHNQRMYYDLIFDAVWNTLRSFGYSHFGTETGAICVLHTWGQNLSLHPHIHCIVPAAEYTLNGQWKNIGHSLHILPRRFVKIRRFGIYNHTTKRNLALQFTAEEKPDIDALIKQRQPPETNVERFERLTGFNPCICPVCKTGRMVIIRELPRIRSPDWSLQIEMSPRC